MPFPLPRCSQQPGWLLPTQAYPPCSPPLQRASQRQFGRAAAGPSARSAEPASEAAACSAGHTVADSTADAAGGAAPAAAAASTTVLSSQSALGGEDTAAKLPPRPGPVPCVRRPHTEVRAKCWGPAVPCPARARRSDSGTAPADGTTSEAVPEAVACIAPDAL